jgi:hypothetical protein
MDDGKLANEMTLEGIAKQLTEMDASLKSVDATVKTLNADMTAMKGDMTAMKGDMKAMDARMTDGFASVDQQLNDAKIRDEEAHKLLKFSLEANVALRESTESRFTAVDKKLDEEVGLLQDVLRHVQRRQTTR